MCVSSPVRKKTPPPRCSVVARLQWQRICCVFIWAFYWWLFIGRVFVFPYSNCSDFTTFSVFSCSPSSLPSSLAYIFAHTHIDSMCQCEHRRNDSDWTERHAKNETRREWHVNWVHATSPIFIRFYFVFTSFVSNALLTVAPTHSLLLFFAIWFFDFRHKVKLQREIRVAIWTYFYDHQCALTPGNWVKKAQKRNEPKKHMNNGMVLIFWTVVILCFKRCYWSSWKSSGRFTSIGLSSEKS